MTTTLALLNNLLGSHPELSITIKHIIKTYKKEHLSIRNDINKIMADINDIKVVLSQQNNTSPSNNKDKKQNIDDASSIKTNGSELIHNDTDSSSEKELDMII